MSNSIIKYENLTLLNSKFETRFKEKLDSFLNFGQYVLGKEVTAFEQSFATYCGAKYCIGVASGLDALVLSLKAFDFPEGSEIIVPSNTFIATILAVVNAGLTPVLVEPEVNTCNISPVLIEAAITSKTKGIIVVHLYGLVADMEAIGNLAKKNKLEIIEDAAQAHGATLNGSKAGSLGTIGAFSFYPTKNLGALGDGGAIVTSDEHLYKRILALRNYGSDKKYYYKHMGLNSRLDELQAAFLNVKLSSLDKMISHKKELARLYDKGLTTQVIKPIYKSDNSHVYHIYAIRTDKRDELKAYLASQGIGTEIHYPVAPHDQEAYKERFDKDYPISETIHAMTLSLPISYATTKVEVLRVIGEVNLFFEKQL